MNDTGITGCTDGVNVVTTCPQALYPGQDAEYGRDSTNNNDADGHAGFSFTKLDSSGMPLADQTAVYTATPWDCVEDNVTGLMWEVKKTNLGLRDTTWTYTWYNSDNTTNGGSVGTAKGGTCLDSNCDTEKYVAAVNAVGICGYTDWRLPSVEELLSIADLSVANPGPTIDTGYFPNSMGTIYWSATPYSAFSTMALGNSLMDGSGLSYTKSVAYAVRLVRGQ